MANLVMTIKEIVSKVLDSYPMPDFVTGAVISTKPMKIKLNDKMILEEIHLYMATSIIGDFPTKVNTKDGIAIGTTNHNLKVGDHVLLGRFKNGENFVILGGVKKL